MKPTFFVYDDFKKINAAWKKSGTFSDEINHHYLKHEVKFKQLANNAIIRNVDLLGYDDGHMVLSVIANSINYSAVASQVRAAGYPENTFSFDLFHNLRLSIPNIEYLDGLLNLLNEIDPAVALIVDEIKQAAAPYSPEDPTIPGWVKSERFNYIRGFGDKLTQKEEYNAPASSKINTVTLLGYSDGTRAISMRFNENSTTTISDAIVAAGFSKPDPLEIHGGHYLLKVSNEDELKKILAALTTVEPSVTAITDKITNSYHLAKKNKRYFHHSSIFEEIVRERSRDMEESPSFDATWWFPR